MRLRLPVAIVSLLLAVAGFAAINPRILGLFHDDGVYAVAAKALADGDGYRIVSLPGDPAQTKYPFVYSALLSVIWRLAPQFPANIFFLKSLNVVILLALFWVSVIYYRRSQADDSGAILPVVYAAIVCTNPLVFSFIDYVLSELLLVLLSVAMLAVCREGNGNSKSSSAFVIGAMAGVACLTRMAALPLALAGFLHVWLNRGARGVCWFLGVFVLLVGPWLLWVAGATDAIVRGSLFDYYVGYDFAGGRGGELPRFLDVVAGNGHYLADSFHMLYLTSLLPGLSIVLAGLTLLGMTVSRRRDDWAPWAFFVSSLVLLLLWPFQSSRYCLPLVPVMALFLCRGVQHSARWFTGQIVLGGALKNLALKIVWAPLAVVLALNLFWLSSFVWSKQPDSTRGLYGSRSPYTWDGFEETFAWLRANTKPDDLLATAYDPMYFLYTGRKAIRPALHRPASYFDPYGKAQPDVGSVAEIKPQLIQLGAKYLIVDPMEGYAERRATLQLMGDIVKAYGNQAQLVFTSSDGLHKVFQLTVR